VNKDSRKGGREATARRKGAHDLGEFKSEEKFECV